MSISDLSGARWRKSSRSNINGGSCVEVAVAVAPGVTAVRDSKDPAGPALVFASAAFGAFLGTVKVGQFDG